MVDKLRSSAIATHDVPGTAIVGDKILVQCRKPGKWVLIRGSEQHHCQQTTAAKNAFAIINKSFTNRQDQ